MLCSLITHADYKEIRYFPSSEGEIRDVPDEMIKMIHECSTDRVQEILNFIFHEISSSSDLPPQTNSSILMKQPTRQSHNA